MDIGRRAIVRAALASAVAANFSTPAVARRTPRKDPGVSLLPTLAVKTDILEIAYAELGPKTGDTVILLHGWPYDIHSFEESAHVLAQRGCRVLIPYLRGFGATRFLEATTFRNGQPAAVASDTIAMMDALNIRTAIIAGFDWGARSADIIAALWPERCRGLVAVSGYLIGGQAGGRKPLAPPLELQWWYQFYFATERGRLGYDLHRRDFNRLIWKIASPKWQFSDKTYARSAVAFDNPDHVDIVIHNYRWRQGLADGERRYDRLEQRLASAPSIRVPTITLEGDANGAPHPDPATYASKFTGPYRHQTNAGGIGHNFPQEAPAAFAKAVLDVRSGSI